MKQIVIVLYTFFFCLFIAIRSGAQSLPVGTPVLEDYYRQKQLAGELDSTISFTIRPLFSSSLKQADIFDPDSSLLNNSWLAFRGNFGSAGPVKFQVLPVSWQQQYNSARPYGWNDGTMIPAAGYQTMISGGFYAKLGPLSIQFRPEYVFAGNKDFATSDIYGGAPDLPARFGRGAYSKATWGQSSIRLSLGPLSLGLSNENLWWGPGMRNSLLMGNSAPGFKHLTLNTVRPVRTPVGSFEMQAIGAKLESSGYSYLDTIPAYADWRYLSGLVLTYQPRWIPGLFLGFTRNFQDYSRDITSVSDYIPLFAPFQKEKDKRNDAAGFDGKDQLASFFSRWVFPKAHAELYFEYGVNDHAYNTRDFIGSPEHSRAYTFGLSKMIALKNREKEFIKLNAEITQMSQSIDRMVRPSGAWYYHGEILQGYTHQGEVVGAGIGPGGNLQTLDLRWVKGIKSLGFQIDRYEHDADYYEASIADMNGYSRRWVDLSAAVYGTWNYKNLLLNARMQFVNSMNYQWKLNGYYPGTFYVPENDVLNFHGVLGISYRF